MLAPIGADARAGDPRPVDYEAGFARAFPPLGDAHRVADWKLYAALADGDIVAYAARIAPDVGRRLDEARGKAYRTEQLEAEIRKDRPTRVAFDAQRRSVQSLVLYADDPEDESDYPTVIKLRWRWRGLGGGTHVRYTDSNGNRVSERNSIVVTTPVDLRLEFVDARGRVLWTAAASPFSPTRRE